MEYCKPSVYRIAETVLNEVLFNQFLEHVGAPGWTSNAATDSELLIEAAGKLCYKSFSVELNPNLARVREADNRGFLDNLLNQRHGSVFEHAYVTYAMLDLSRIATHELVRHRLANYSQESLRFVRPTSLKMYYPEAFDRLTTDPVTDDQMIKLIDIHNESPDAGRLRIDHADSIRDCVLGIFEQHVTDVERVHKMLTVLVGLDNATRPFHEKKRLTSALRRLLPDGMATGIIMTANHRVWRDVIERRTSVAAEEEIRYIFNSVALDLAGQFPAIYQDMDKGEEEDGIPERKFFPTPEFNANVRKDADMNSFTNYYGLMPDAMIRQYCTNGGTMIFPFVDYDHALTNNDPISFGLTSTGYDMRVGRTFYVFKGTRAALRIDPKDFDPSLFDVIEIPVGDVFHLPANGFALCSSMEYFRMPHDVQATCLAKSTYARCGMIVHVTPLEAAWEGILTIEISNQSPLPITVYPTEGIAQLQFNRVPWIERNYAQKGGKYMGQQGITLPRMRKQSA